MKWHLKNSGAPWDAAEEDDGIRNWHLPAGPSVISTVDAVPLGCIYAYMMAEPRVAEGRLVKVGMTTKSAVDRVLEQSRANRRKYKLIGVWDCTNPRTAETLLWEFFGPLRVKFDEPMIVVHSNKRYAGLTEYIYLPKCYVVEDFVDAIARFLSAEKLLCKNHGMLNDVIGSDDTGRIASELPHKEETVDEIIDRLEALCVTPHVRGTETENDIQGILSMARKLAQPAREERPSYYRSSRKHSQ